MAYRITRKQREQLARMREAKAQKRIDGDAPDYPAELPHLRRQIIIIDYDFGQREHRLDLYRTNRIDCYRVEVDGQPWKTRIGWSKLLEGLRKSMPRVQANG